MAKREAEEVDSYPEDFIARSRSLARIVAVGSAVLVVLLLLLPFTMEHALQGAQLLLWGSILLIVTLIVGISLVYSYMSKYVSVRRGALSRASRETPSAPREQEARTLQLLPEDERAAYRRVLHEGGEVFQKDLLRMLGFSGSKLTRVLDRLESKGLIVRERHGMTNRIRLTGPED